MLPFVFLAVAARDGHDRRGRRADLRRVRAARGVPLRHRREHPRHRGVLGAVASPGRRRWSGGVAAAILFAVLLLPRIRLLQVVALAMLVIALGRRARSDHLSWSPYYKISAVPQGRTRTSTVISVNGIPHQSATPVAGRRTRRAEYLLPYERSLAPLDDVLIVGAGSGTDVAARARRRGEARRRRRDRSSHPADRRAAAPGPAVRRPSRERPHR